MKRDAITPAQRERLVDVLEVVRGADDRPAADFVADVLLVLDGAELECERCGSSLERDGRLVKPCAMCSGCTGAQAVEVLNALTRADALAMLRLVDTRVLLNPEGIPPMLEAAAEVVPSPVPPAVGAVLLAEVRAVDGVYGWPTLNMVGVLNGLFGTPRHRLTAHLEPRGDGAGVELVGWDFIDEDDAPRGANDGSSST